MSIVRRFQLNPAEKYLAVPVFGELYQQPTGWFSIPRSSRFTEISQILTHKIVQYPPQP